MEELHVDGTQVVKTTVEGLELLPRVQFEGDHFDESRVEVESEEATLGVHHTQHEALRGPAYTILWEWTCVRTCGYVSKHV